jgi:aryl-alcohol dehydrogenase-like predicted oxidoreductase
MTLPLRRLGPAGPMVSAVALGCSGVWGQRFFPEEKAQAVVRRAVERGINFFDTGHNYCNYNAEPRLGRALREVFAERPRAGFVVSSKIGTVIPSVGLVGRSRAAAKNFAPDYIERTLARSIANLGCGYLDVLFLHDPTRADLTDGLLGELGRMRRAGLFNLLGVNTHDPALMNALADLAPEVGAVLIDYSLARTDREPAIARLAARGVAVLAGTVLAQGHLFGRRFPRLHRPGDLWYLARALLKRESRTLAADAREAAARLRAAGIDVSVATAISYVLANPGITACVFGTTEPRHLDAVADAAASPMPADRAEAIRRCLRQDPRA